MRLLSVVGELESDSFKLSISCGYGDHGVFLDQSPLIGKVNHKPCTGLLLASHHIVLVQPLVVEVLDAQAAVFVGVSQPLASPPEAVLA